jgi:AbrB family looped-hinge helix DNA binding protein
MIVGTIVTPNQKGQIVIPQKIRADLNIKPQKPLNLVARDRVIYIYPINEVITSTEHETSYLDTLKATQGAWSNDSWTKTKINRQKTELKASQKRKKPW